ncbi:hypothetical protein [Planctomycetes bacterium K23_9]|uniref:Uncharacterized protein n=1 Tax=Stieleria marina TaxID=1930275 RepID=A0A517NTM7_9BACT|nr:hypothetical protein K239x_24260 [Planctomycetes bacterium K23_9]
MSDLTKRDLDSESSDGDGSSLIDTLAYGLTLPERTARSVSAVIGGLVNETAARLIPTAFRSSRSYSVFVQQALDMMVHDVGGVKSTADAQAPTEQESQLAQKAVGGLLDVAGAATLHLSPMTVLAVFSDVAYGSSHYLKKLSDELKREGIIDSDSSIDRVSDLVDALQKTSQRAADAMDTPPVSIEGLRKTISQLSLEASQVDPRNLLPQSEVERLWTEMESAASDANVGLWDVSTTMTMYAMNRVTLTTRGALSTVTVASGLFDEHIIAHYRDALDKISDDGLYATLSTASTPYLEAVWHNFDENRETWTEELITGRLIGKAWQGVRGWFGSDDEPSA